MTNHQMHPKELLVGALIGSVLGGVSALLAAPASGEKIRRELSNACCHLNERAHDFAESVAEKGKCLSKMAGCSSGRKGKADILKTALGRISDSIHSSREDESEHCTRDFMIGGVVGGVLGAVAGLLLAPKPGEELRQDLYDTYESVSDQTDRFTDEMTKKGKKFVKTASNKTDKWLNIARDVVEELTEGAQSAAEEIGDKAKDFGDHRLKDAMEFASLGLRLWERLRR